ncbi:MAG TPA: NADH-quinone oxidoreductase subunit K [Candidatus Omnitrophota bacterium]|nr:NADH-quinone oxidoreductase subunit K [Candidatus Omnitrophota bacterium]HPD84230.1 NADH-quinone oxidoreductase subunit K [Candidatus Omnitrophota bacterium]HRZ03086.1 NADH-quinone oxidoreductase subunit K [Candidatus Omnitrophota bacterium]
MSPDLTQVFWPFSAAAILLFVMGTYYVLVTFNLIRALIGVEILIKGATLLIILAGYVTGNTGLTQALVITLIVIEVVIMVVAGGVILCVYRNNKSIDVRELRSLKG